MEFLKSLARTYIYTVENDDDAIAIIQEFIDKFGSREGARIKYAVKDLSEDVEERKVRRVVRVRPPILQKRKELEKTVQSLKKATLHMTIP